MKRQNFVLDSSALLDFMEAGPGAERIERLFREARQTGIAPQMSVVNWGELFYYLWQHHGEEAARSGLADLSRLPLELVPVDIAQSLQAGQIKALHKMPYVDSLVAALAILRGAILVTADRDFEKLGKQFPILWLNRP